MANTTSETTTFDKTFSIDEIIEDAFERIGLNSVAGYQLKSARRSLNILFQEWGNRGLHYWEVGSSPPFFHASPIPIPLFSLAPTPSLSLSRSLHFLACLFQVLCF